MRVLVDMDVTKIMRYKVLVERKDFAFFVELGHYMEICKNINKENMQEKAGTTRYPNKVPRMEFVQTRDGRKEHGNFAENPIIVENIEPMVNKDKLSEITNKQAPMVPKLLNLYYRNNLHINLIRLIITLIQYMKNDVSLVFCTPNVINNLNTKMSLF